MNQDQPTMTPEQWLKLDAFLPANPDDLDKLDDQQLVSIFQQAGLDLDACVAPVTAALQRVVEQFYCEQRRLRWMQLRMRVAPPGLDYTTITIEKIRKLYDQALAHLSPEQKQQLCFGAAPVSDLDDAEVLKDFAILETLGVLEQLPK